MNPTAIKRAYSIKSAAEQIDAGRDAVYAAVRTGALKAKKLGRRTLILDEDLTAFLRSLPELDLRDHQVESPTCGSVMRSSIALANARPRGKYLSSQ